VRARDTKCSLLVVPDTKSFPVFHIIFHKPAQRNPTAQDTGRADLTPNRTTQNPAKAPRPSASKTQKDAESAFNTPHTKFKRVPAPQPWAPLLFFTHATQHRELAPFCSAQNNCDFSREINLTNASNSLQDESQRHCLDHVLWTARRVPTPRTPNLRSPRTPARSARAARLGQKSETTY